MRAGGAERGQVTSGGEVRAVSGVGAKGTSRMTLGGGTGLGTHGALRLADLLREAPPPMLAKLNLRCPPLAAPSCVLSDSDYSLVLLTHDMYPAVSLGQQAPAKVLQGRLLNPGQVPAVLLLSQPYRTPP